VLLLLQVSTSSLSSSSPFNAEVKEEEQESAGGGGGAAVVVEAMPSLPLSLPALMQPQPQTAMQQPAAEDINGQQHEEEEEHVSNWEWDIEKQVAKWEMLSNARLTKKHVCK
jgi:hypothetical protein